MVTRCVTKAFALCAALLVAGIAAAQAPRLAAAPAVIPKIVVQGMAMGGFDVAAWSADNRFVFTASGILRELLVWDITAGVIVDRVRLPSGVGALSEFMKLDSMVLQPDGRTLQIDGVVLDPASPDLRGPRRYAVDINTRQVRIITARALAPLQPGDDWSQMMQRWVQALSAVHGQGTDMTRADAERLLPALPRSPDGSSTLLRRGLAFVVRDAAGKEHKMQAGARALGGIDDADLSPDDRRLAMLSLAGDDVPGVEITSLVEFFDIADGRFLSPFQLVGEYNFIHWISPGRLFVLAQDIYDDPLDDTSGEAPDGQPAPVVLYDADAGREVARLPARCFMTAMPDGSLLVLEQHAAKLDADKKPVVGSDGFYQADRLLGYTAMERGAGWGKDIPELLRNEDWNYAAFTAAKQMRTGINQADCLACHKPLDKVSYTFSIEPLKAVAARR